MIPAPAGAPVRSLDVHAQYRCGRSGVCCSAGWDIPVELPVYRGLRTALADGRLASPAIDPLPASAELPEPYAALLGRAAAGQCVFLARGPDGRHRCAVHDRLGESALPSTCRHFPRVCLLTPLGVDVSLSHFCPTAAGLLFRGVPPRIVEQPAAFPAASWYEGLDGRSSPGPLLRPGVFLGWDAHRVFEAFAVSALAGGHVPEALDAITLAAERARTWSADAGPFDRFLATVLGDPATGPVKGSDGRSLWAELVSAVPATVRLDDVSRAALGADPAQAAPAGTLATLPAARAYVATRTFASWLSVQGRGLRTTARGPRLAWESLRVQVGRLAPGARDLDDVTLQAAIRASDLVLVHLCAPEVLAARLSVAEG